MAVYLNLFFDFFLIGSHVTLLHIKWCIFSYAERHFLNVQVSWFKIRLILYMLCKIHRVWSTFSPNPCLPPLSLPKSGISLIDVVWRNKVQPEAEAPFSQLRLAWEGLRWGTNSLQLLCTKIIKIQQGHSEAQRSELLWWGCQPSDWSWASCFWRTTARKAKVNNYVDCSGLSLSWE